MRDFVPISAMYLAIDSRSKDDLEAQIGYIANAEPAEVEKEANARHGGTKSGRATVVKDQAVI